MRSTADRSLLRPDAESIISAIQGPQEKVVFVSLFPYYSKFYVITFLTFLSQYFVQERVSFPKVNTEAHAN